MGSCYLGDHIADDCIHTDIIFLNDVAVIQWITSCLINRMITRVITPWRVHVTSLTTAMSTMRCLIEIMIILKAIKFYFKGLMINRISHSYTRGHSYKFIKLAEGLFH